MKKNTQYNSTLEENHKNMEKLKEGRKWKFVWRNVIFFTTTHTLALYGVYLCFTKAMWSTLLFTYVLAVASNVGSCAGAHRLWSHRAYKVKLPLKIIILVMYTLSFQGSVHQWVRDHRGHHKFCDTDADPYNSRRGFFFSHIGWLLVKKHPAVTNKGSLLDLSDVENDRLLQIQRKYYYVCVLIISIVLPASVPILWGEDLWTSFIVADVLRHVVSSHGIFCINSVAHMWGTKPYDKTICPVENKFVSIVAVGEGFHNYHHTFPWDYKAAELGGYKWNISWLFIDLMAKIGWAYDLKTATQELIEKRVMKSGDGTHPVWGWSDRDLPDEYKQSAKILY